MWLRMIYHSCWGSQTRPDISFEVLDASTNMKHPEVEQILWVNKAIRKTKSEKSCILFSKLGRFEDMKLHMFCDASWANLSDGSSSTVGFVVLVSGASDKYNVLSWGSHKARRKVQSTLAAETLAMLSGLDEALYLANVITELYCGDYVHSKIPIIAYTDSKSLHENIHSTKQVSEKRLRVAVAEIEEMLSAGSVTEIRWVPAHLQIANCLTKRGASSDSLLEMISSGRLQLA